MQELTVPSDGLVQRQQRIRSDYDRRPLGTDARDGKKVPLPVDLN